MIDEKCININVEPEGAIDPPLTSCTCPQNLGPFNLDAATPARITRFTVTVRNLCPNKDFIIVVSVHTGTRILGQQCRIVTNRGQNCGTVEETFTVAIAEPLCSTANVEVQVLGNYVNCCGTL